MIVQTYFRMVRVNQVYFMSPAPAVCLNNATGSEVDTGCRAATPLCASTQGDYGTVCKSKYRVVTCIHHGLMLTFSQ